MEKVILDHSELYKIVENLKSLNKCIVLANGCFDLLHVGHIRYLKGAKSQGDILIVALNSDESISRIKSKGRPIIPCGERVEIVAALEVVDYVTVFNEPTVRRLLELLKPDVHAKGTDYTVDNVPERNVVKAYGGRISIVGDKKGHSTSELIKIIIEKCGLFAKEI